MYPSIYATCSVNATVQAQFGGSEPRLYPFGEAPFDVTLPYAVWQVTSGLPENCMNAVPDVDNWGLQIDVYASTASAARTAAQSLRDAIEPVAHITSWGGESRDPTTNHYRYRFNVDWWEERSESST